MKILDGYIFKEIFSLMGILLFVFIFVTSLWRLPFFSELIIIGAPLSQVLLLIGYMILPFLALSIPLAVLAATAMAYSRLSSDGEIVAMKAAGHSMYRFLISPLILGLISFVAMFHLTLFAEPQGINAFQDTAFRIISSNLRLKLKEGEFIRDFDGLVIYLEEVDPRTGVMKGIMLSDQRGGRTPRSIFAREGILLKDPKAFRVTLRLKDGSIHSPTAEKGKYHLLTFTENDLSLDVNKVLESNKRKLESVKKFDLNEIKIRLNTLSRDHELYYPTLVEYHNMFATPFAVILFALIGPALGIRNRRLGRSGGFVSSIVIAFLYYMLLTAGKGLGDENLITPALAVWAPNFALLGYCVFIIPRIDRETSTGLADIVVGFIRNRAARL